MFGSRSRRLLIAIPVVAVALIAGACSSNNGGSSASTTSGGGSSSSATPTLKVALVAPSAVNDLAFTQSMVEALNTVKAKYNLQVAVSDNQFVVSDAANILRQYASQGYNLVIAHGSQYGGTIQQLAPQFPKVSFAWGTAGSTFNLPNVFAYQANSNEGGYVEGYTAALLSKTHVLGVIGPIAVGDAKLYVDGFAAGAKAANPKTVVHVTYTGSFSDVSLMSKAATAYLADNADVMTGSSQSVVGAIGVCKANNVAWFGTQWTQDSLAPDQVVASQVYDWTGILEQIITAIKGGTLGGATYSLTLGNGGEKISFNSGYTVPPDVMTAVQKVISGIEDGSISVPQ